MFCAIFMPAKSGPLTGRENGLAAGKNQGGPLEGPLRLAHSFGGSFWLAPGLFQANRLHYYE